MRGCYSYCVLTKESNQTEVLLCVHKESIPLQEEDKVTSITYYKIRVMFNSITTRVDIILCLTLLLQEGDMFTSLTYYMIRVMFNFITARGRYGYLYYYKGEICLPSFCFKFFIYTDIK